MKVALLNPTFLMRRPIAEMAKLLAERGHQVTVIWPMDKKKLETNQRHFDALLTGKDNITVLPIWSYEIKAILWSIPLDWYLFSKLRRAGRENQVVQIWAPFYPMPLLPFIMKRLGLFKAAIIGTYDTIPAYSFSMGKNTDRLFKAFFAMLTKPLLEAAKISTIYSKLLIPFAKQAGFSEKKLRVLPTGVNLELKPVSANIREEFTLAEKTPLILFVGLLNRRKGVYVILETAKLLKEKNVDFHLLMVGSGPEKAGVRAKIAELGLEAEVDLVGSRKDVHNFYHQCACLFLPATGEGLPGVVMEAMSYGRAVVSSDIPCLPDLVAHGKNGFLHDPQDVQAFAGSLQKILEDASLRTSMEKESLRRISSWSWPQRCEECLEIYQEASKA